jgi:serine/threonine protein kinase
MERVGDYIGLEQLAEGGTGLLFRARRADDPDGDPCALKVVHDRFRRNSFYTATLFSEVPAARRFRHASALGLFAVDDVEGVLYVATELATGPSWREIRDRARSAGRTFSDDAVLWMGRQVADLLGAAAAAPWAEGETEGLIIGQLAPQSIFITKTGEVRVSGVGLGRSRSCLPPTRSRLPYRAPELFSREPVRPATDVYGLGLVLNDAIDGTETFQRDSVAEVKAAVLEEVPPPLDHVDPAVGAVIAAMIAKDPDDRPADLHEVARTLGRAVERDASLLRAEWAEHVRVLFPELFDARGPVSSPRRPRVSVMYSHTAPARSTSAVRPTGSIGPTPAPTSRPAPSAPRGSASAPGLAPNPAPNPAPGAAPGAALVPGAPLSAAVGPPARIATADLGPSTYDIEDLAALLAAGRVSDRGAAPAARPRAEAREPTGSDPKRELAGLSDDSAGFDVDSVVDAIFAGATPSPAPLPIDLEPSPRAPAPAARAPDLEPTPRVEPTSSLDLERALDSGDLDTDVIPRARSVDADEAPTGGVPPPAARSVSSPWSVPHVSETATAGEGRLRRSAGVDARLGPPTVPPSEDRPPDEPRLVPGSVLQDRYRIIEELGRGGMSIVYRAEHTLLLKEVALKLLRPELSTLGNVVERFQREARSVCRLDDPNIVRVTDFGRTPEGLLYLVMDLIRGRSLSSLIREEGRRPAREAIGLVDQILAGLEHAHRFEIVHRDLKPENIMLVTKGSGVEVKILDFGIAKLGGGDEDAKSITQAGTVFGTPRYMSPEQAAGSRWTTGPTSIRWA